MDIIFENIVPIGVLLLLIFACYVAEFLLRRRLANEGKPIDKARYFGYIAIAFVLVLVGLLVYVNAGTEWVLAALLLALFGAML